MYLLFWASAIADYASTVTAFTLSPNVAEINALGTMLDPVNFLIFAVCVNALYFWLIMTHQKRWGHGALLLAPSIMVHSVWGINNVLILIH